MLRDRVSLDVWALMSVWKDDRLTSFGYRVTLAEDLRNPACSLSAKSPAI